MATKVTTKDDNKKMTTKDDNKKHKNATKTDTTPYSILTHTPQ